MTPDKTKPRVMSSNAGLHIFGFSQSRQCENTELFASLQIPFDMEFRIHFRINSMKHRFICDGGRYLSDIPLARSKYLREKSELLLDGFNTVWKAISDRYGNYVKFVRLGSDDIALIFMKLYRDSLEFYQFVKRYPDLFLHYKECYG
jgi:hypothetical protein